MTSSHRRGLVTGAGGFIGSHMMPWGLFGVLAGWLGRPLIQRDRRAALERFKVQVEGRVRQAIGEPEQISA
jgi:hypothetical protein